MIKTFLVLALLYGLFYVPATYAEAEDITAYKNYHAKIEV